MKPSCRKKSNKGFHFPSAGAPYAPLERDCFLDARWGCCNTGNKNYRRAEEVACDFPKIHQGLANTRGFGTKLQNFATIMEMFMAAIAFHFSYSYSPHMEEQVRGSFWLWLPTGFVHPLMLLTPCASTGNSEEDQSSAWVNQVFICLLLLSPMLHWR